MSKKHEVIKPRTGLRWAIPSALLLVGLGLVVWAIFGLYPTPPAQDSPVTVPEASVNSDGSERPSPVEQTETPANEAAPLKLYPTKPAVGEKIGTITLPSLDLSWPIYEGTEEEQLALGVGHFEGSVLPGITDNSVLSGHRTTVFNRLGELNEGETIIIGTEAGVFTYQIREFQIVPRTSREIIVPTETAVLTLTTCYPFNSPFRTTDAFIVSADLIDSVLSPNLTN